MNELAPHSSTVPAPNAEAELLVRRSDELLAQFDARRIAEALVRETKLAPEIAHQISLEVKQQIKNLGIQTLTAPLIRGLVDARLLEHGLTAAHRLHARLGVPLYDADQILQGAAVDFNATHGPEGTSVALAEAIKREYAMLSVFSEQVANAHLSGALHVENIGEIDRLTTMIGSIDFIKRNGISLPGGFAGSRPARRPEVLAAHLVKYTAALHGYFSQAIAWDAVNFAFAPLLEGTSHEEKKQVAQALLFELATPAVAHGGQPLRCELHLDWDAPAYLRTRPAIGAGGEQLEKTYEDYGEVAREFLSAMFEVFLDGDGQGWPLIGSHLILHVTSRFIENPGYRTFLDLASRVAIERGGVTFAFDRAPEDDETNTTFMHRYGMQPTVLQRAQDSWQWRAAILSSVALNLPRLAKEVDADAVKVLESLSELMELAAQAALEKRVFLEKLLARGEAGVLSLLAMRPGNELFLRLNWTAHAICPIGLNELVTALTGQSLGASAETQALGKQIVAHLQAETERLSAKHKVRFVLAESRDLTAVHRLAKLDAFAPQAPQEAVSGATFYTNSIKLPSPELHTALEKLAIEGNLLEKNIFGAATELWEEEIPLKPEHVAVLISRAFYQTNCSAFTLSPVFTICAICHHAAIGMVSACPQCGNAKVDVLAPAANHYSRISTWPKWKVSELKLRRHVPVT